MTLRASQLILVLVPILIFAALIYFYGLSHKVSDGAGVVIKDHKFDVDVADTPALRQKGLSGRESLGKDEGLLFIFSRPSVQRFWMKDMLISIDIIWIQGGEVVGIIENVHPEPGVSVMNLTIYSSPVPVDRVFEIPAGVAGEIGITVGDAVSIRL